jgi:hypothetical protein
MDDIKQLIKDYILADDQLVEINKQVKELRKAKNGLEENIKTYMIDNSIAKVDIGTGTLRISKSKPAKKINKKIVMEVLKEHVEEKKAESISEDIFSENTEDVEEVFKLERTRKK